MKYYYKITYESPRGDYDYLDGVAEIVKQWASEAQALAMAQDIANAAGIKRIVDICVRLAEVEDYI